MELATFAGGCFWCMEPPYDKLPGVEKITVGYIGGQTINPTYKEVCTGTTGHTEAVQLEFDPDIISYEALLDVFWKNINPTQLNGQFYDLGTQYRTGIFYHSAEQKVQAEKSKKNLEASKKFANPIVTEITEATQFFPAEEMHQKYFKKSPEHYKRYSVGSGRVEFKNATWGSGN
ncbi:peptide-methionine (S)-S-oxide reductase MsrA [Leptospira sp. GIMC2001]|uniref:peptide-methionine (S)-S-oxide reductase MsrA n=1 Tax=Leptospira sp. GIMC2001 TaxID=1513297 RepID=UPI002348F2CF|nr:peptide-methionine (S)-S-oxide reductase MsrA [Leptospira sp. GIMC2001]WCL48402.1 peptide-methionine (S)-S-oxide reductase MsrA [Leptospira sp. GIMC2001]